MILGLKDIWIMLELGAALVIALLILFVIPKDINREAPVYILDETGVFQTLTEAFGLDEAERKKAGNLFVDTREEVLAGMTKNRNAFGMIINTQAEGQFSIELLTQPYVNEAMVDYFKVQMTDIFSMLSQHEAAYAPEIFQKVSVTALQENARDTIPFNQRMVPMILAFIVGLMGLFTMISVIGQERADQTIRAYKVTPATLWQMLTSKHLMLLTVGMVTFSILYLIPVGFHGYLLALLVIIPTLLIGNSLGVMLGSFFDNPMSALGWVFLIMVLFALPGISLFNPVFSPDWLRFLPTYYTLFGLDAAIFPDGYSNNLWISIAVLSGIALILIPLSGVVFTRKLRKEF